MKPQAIAAAVGTALIFGAGWAANGWRADARIARVESSQSKKDAAQANKAQAATENKTVAVLNHAAAQQDNTHDYTKILAALLMLPVLQACSATSEVQPQAMPSLQVTPLPAEVSQIDTKDSQSWRQKAQDWLVRLTAWSQGEMPK